MFLPVPRALCDAVDTHCELSSVTLARAGDGAHVKRGVPGSDHERTGSGLVPRAVGS